MAKLQRALPSSLAYPAGLPRIVAAGLSKLREPKEIPRYTLSHFELDFEPIRPACVRSELNGQAYDALPGAAYLFRPGDVYASTIEPGKQPYTCHWVRWDLSGGDGLQSGAARVMGLPRCIRLGLSEQRELIEAYDALREAHHGGRPGWMEVAAGQLLVALGILRRAVESPAADTAAGPAVERRLGLSLAFIEGHFAERLKLADLARASGWSEDYFGRVFRRAFGRSPLQHLLDRRVQEGRRLLAGDPRLTVPEAAHRSGFDDARHFARQFKRRYGQSPAAFRDALAQHRFPSAPAIDS
ncbi:MAG: helix-turn-helix transcriptional regulator [Planctomycetes bacterium]|nr:helix-turn-helix transcriptional regulator [Planctomycetota bacterium]